MTKNDRFKGFFVISTVSVAVLIVSIFLFYITIKRNYEKLERDVLSNTTLQCVNYMEANLNLKIQNLLTISQTDELRGESGIEDKINYLNKFIAGKPDFEAEICDLNANSVSTAGFTQSVFNEAFFKTALTGETAISGPFFSDSLNKWVMKISAPIFRNTKDLIGVLSFVYTIEEIFGITGIAGLGMDGYAFVIDSDVNVVAEYENFDNNGAIKRVEIQALNREDDLREDIYRADSNSARFKFFNEAVYFAAKEKSGTAISELGGVKIAAFKNIDRTDLILICVSSKDFIVRDIDRMVILVIILFTLVSLVILFFMFRFRKAYREVNIAMQKSEFAINAANLIVVEIKEDGQIISCNENLLKKTNLAYNEIIGKKIYKLTKEFNNDDFNRLIDNVTTYGFISNLELMLNDNNGKHSYIMWNANRINDLNSSYIELVGFDITNLKEYQNKVKELAYYDTLTNLPNKTYFKEYVDGLLEKNIPFAMYYIDLDNFKFINETYGHAVGDKFISEICENINSVGVSNALVCRQGGDEISVAYTKPMDFGEVGDYANYISNIISQEYIIDNIKITTTCSIGISIYPKDGDTFVELYRAADVAMNKSKEMGKARATFFSSRMNQELMEYLQLVNDLKAAIKNEEFVMYYQPQFDLQSGKLLGFESLIRWVSPARGFLSPGLFINVAEKNGLIIPLGNFALRASLAFVKEAVDLGFEDVCIAINVSAKQVIDEYFVPNTLKEIKESGVSAKNIELELTESTLMDSVEIIRNKLETLCDEGLKLALDDFGTGYSSLTYLKKFPFHVLKIDKSFVDTILDTDSDKEIISTIIKLAHALKLKVVAEGVEERVQYDWLAMKGCNICQGYLTGRPLPRDEALKLVKDELIKNSNGEK